MNCSLNFFLILIPLMGFGQKAPTLSEILWNRVKTCHSLFEDEDDDGKLDFDKIDDSRNGYLKISGDWPTCGCSCSSTVGAYKNDAGEYTILQSDEMLCSWKKETSSNKDLKDILPTDFGINNFTSKAITEKNKQPIFFLDIVIPRIGTDTKVKIKLIPFGLKVDGIELLCYDYQEGGESWDNITPLSKIERIASKTKDSQTLECILTGDFETISENDKSIVSKIIGNDSSQKKLIEEIRRNLSVLKKVYTIYSNLDFHELTLGWNKYESKFFIKEKGSKPKKITFREFLIKSEFWGPRC